MPWNLAANASQVAPCSGRSADQPQDELPEATAIRPESWSTTTDPKNRHGLDELDGQALTHG